MDRLRLLMLEDNPNDAELIQARLDEAGIAYDVVRADGRAGFVEALDDGGFDLILADFSLPAFDGRSALGIARDRCPAVPFLFVSGALGEELAIELLKAGATDYVLKQSLERLVPAVRRALLEAAEREDRKRAETTLALLAEASRLLAASLDYRATLDAVARLIVPRLADCCIVDIVEDDGGVKRLVAAHRDPAKEDGVCRLLRAYPPSADATFSIGRRLREATPRLYAEITDGMLRRVAVDADHLHLLRELAPRSGIIVPLVARGAARGAISFILCESPHRYAEHDMALAQEVSRRAAVAIENARLYALAQDAIEAIRVSETRYRTMIEQSPMSIQVFAPDGAFLLANPAWEELWRMSREELRGYNILRDDQIHRQGMMPLIERAFAGDAAVVPAHYYDPGESGATGRARWVEAFIYPVKDEAGGVREVVLKLRDVTGWKQAEEERARLLEREQQARAVAERLYREAQESDRRKDEFLAVLAHELRNPLAPIVNALHVLRLGGGDPGTQARVREVLERQVNQMTHLIDDLLDVSRITMGKIQIRRDPVDLSALIRETCDDHRSAIDAAGLRISVELPCDSIWVAGDRTRLAQALGNLIQNSTKFTEPGGRVSVHAARDLDAGSVVVTVSDTGVGIDAGLLDRLFEPFTQADRSLDRSRGGLGLGLTLVKGFIAQHGGTVTARSDGPGRGSEFRVALPLAQPASRPDERGVDSSGDEALSVRVLVIEDNSDAAASLRDVLALFGCVVEVAHSGPEGLEAARRFRPEVVLCDVGLPGMNGYAVARELRSDLRTAGAYLVAASGYGQDEDRRRSAEAGFDLHLTKPVAPDLLWRLLATRSADRSPRSSEIA